MKNPIALLVDDDPQQAQEVVQTLEEADFEVITCSTARQAFDFLSDKASARSIDLCVLDRKLPLETGDIPSDAVGDTLFEHMKESLSGARIIVFSGHTDFEHYQTVASGGGQLLPHTSDATARITVIRKAQFDQFEVQLTSFRNLIRRIDDIELDSPSATTPRDRRLLKRVAYQYGASKIEAKLLAGGLSGSTVWSCAIADQNGPVSRVVVKCGSRFVPAGGLQELLPPGLVAARVGIVDDLSGGTRMSLLQVAGIEIVPLMDLVAAEPAAAVRALERVTLGLDGLSRGVQQFQLASIIQPLIEWSDADRLLTEHGIVVPSPTMWISSKTHYSHGDLHPGNVLVSAGLPVIIDCDGQGVASGLLDPMTLLFSTAVHPDSPIRGSAWLSVSDITSTLGTSAFGEVSPSVEWFNAVNKWVSARSTGPREFWAIALGYASRQLRYANLTADPAILELIVAIANRASSELGNS